MTGRRRALAAGVIAVVAAGATAAEARAPQPRVVAAYAYFHPATGRLAKRELGTIELVVRLDRRVGYTMSGQLKFGTNVGGQAAVAYTISRRDRCYGSAAVVERDGTISSSDGGRRPAAAGAPVRVQVFNDRPIFSRSLIVLAQRPGLARGRALGCRPERR